VDQIRKAYKVSVGEHEGKRPLDVNGRIILKRTLKDRVCNTPLQRPRYRRKDNIKRSLER
jgi:hypothetical protein